jgi:sigma-B regulation protein RsbU (phosphoserine phosphatase)
LSPKDCIDHSVHTFRRVVNVNERNATIASDACGTENSITRVMESTRKVVECVMHDLPVGILLSDEKGGIVSFNATAQRILGCEVLDVDPDDRTRTYGLHLPDNVTPFPADQLPLARALRGEVVTGVELFVRNERVPSGVWISASAAPWRDEDGGVSGGVVVFRDISSEKRSLEELKRLSSAVEQTADGVIITDLKGTITYVNTGFEEMTGYSREEAVGQTPRLLKSGKHEARFYQDLWKTVLGGKVFRGTLINRKKSGRLYDAEQTITPVRGSDGRHAFLVSVQKDISERLRNEQLQVEMNVAREVQQRLYPKRAPRLPGFDIAGAAFPAATMCGDLFDFFPMPGDCLGLAVADVCGHGVGPSLLMAQARAYLRTLALSCFDVGELLRRLNEILVVDSDVKDYLTLLVTRLDPRARTLTHASAGHVTGYLLDRGGEIRERLESTGIPLGMFAGQDFPSGPTLALEPEEIVVLFSDGMTEAAELDGNAGTDRLLEFIKDHRHCPSADIAEGLYRTAQSLQGNRPQIDDMTVVICKLEASP